MTAISPGARACSSVLKSSLVTRGQYHRRAERVKFSEIHSEALEVVLMFYEIREDCLHTGLGFTVVPVTRISGTRKGLRGSGPGWPCATPGLAPIPPAGRRGPHRSAFPSLSDAASRSPTPPVGGRL